MARRRRRRKPRYRVLKALVVIILMLVALLAGVLFAKDFIDKRQEKSAVAQQTGLGSEGADSNNLGMEEPAVGDESNVGEGAYPSAVDEQPEASNESDWDLILINGDNLVPSDYQVELTQLSNGKSVATRIYPNLQKMFDDARSAGIYPIVREGYRTSAEQEALMIEKVAAFEAEGNSKEQAQELAKGWVAVPGTSEHQLGIAIDINGDGANSASEVVYDWLANNAHKYGFILRYPSDKVEITKTQFEPWHYRYVGEKAAGEIYSRGICLEEYLAE